MLSPIKHICSLTFSVLALGAAVSQANARQLYRGTVSLPHETSWGGAVLQPGPHIIQIEDGFDGIPVIHVFGQGEQLRIRGSAFDLEPLSSHGSLTLVNVGGTSAVKRFDAGVIGKSFDFNVSKVKRSKMERAGAEPGTTVSVSSAP
jgi:hypothetical protein